MFATTKLSIVTLALCAGLVAVQAAGGIKGNQQRADSSIKGPVARPPQQTYLPPPPPQQALPPPPPPPPPAPIKGFSQAAPVFSAARVAPIQQQEIVQQQQQQIVEQEPIQQQQQQQQQEEIDPNAAAQEAGPAIAAPIRVAPAGAAAAASEEEANPRPEPYAFQYSFEAADQATSGSSQREEQQDANGRVTGFYTLKGEDGRDRRVDYVADASGFRATISTNEMGTAPKDSADVDWNAQSPSDGQLRVAESATQAARQRALSSPQAAASSASGSLTGAQKINPSPRQNAAAASAARASFSKTNQQQQQQIQQQPFGQQLQEPFEQIRQVELSGRARKSRHAPFYLYTI